MRGALTGCEGSVEVGGSGVLGFVVAGFDVTGFEVAGFVAVVFSGDLLGLFGATFVFGRFLPGLVAGPEVFGFSFGRDVRKAPRTSSSCKAGAAVPRMNTLRQTNPKTMTLDRITNLLVDRSSSCGSVAVRARRR
jgi:hypothetical protein